MSAPASPSSSPASSPRSPAIRTSGFGALAFGASAQQRLAQSGNAPPLPHPSVLNSVAPVTTTAQIGELHKSGSKVIQQAKAKVGLLGSGSSESSSTTSSASTPSAVNMGLKKQASDSQVKFRFAGS
eukprot:TRINITY_DN5246_c1_g1_i1.p1 TRINITY_DN5246_c1_g1~~TRINITY_DN5246_c1_g1_i1.p1  ORF type:complete len:127 (+),score=26.82 TRINITY_DN5246_c1_g1_i1:3-383(+)